MPAKKTKKTAAPAESPNPQDLAGPSEHPADSLLHEALRVVELVHAECTAVQTWQFWRKQSGNPDPEPLTSLRDRLREHLL